MDTRQAYNIWAAQYDTNENKTRDLEAEALRSELKDISFVNCLEIGCGTGKNSEWLVSRAETVTGVDLSEAMLTRARKKLRSEKINFIQADITNDWNFVKGPFDLITFSLILEHIENLDDIFRKAVSVLKPGGLVYVGELHPFKQYSGSRARFETDKGLQVVPCFTHHVSDFCKAATKHGFQITRLNEYFDPGNATGIPRILTILFQK